MTILNNPKYRFNSRHDASSSAVEDNKLLCKENVDRGSAYFFFDGRSGETDLALHHKMLRSLIFQLSHQTHGLPAALLLAYDKGYEQPSVTSLENALQSIIQEFERVYLVIDALDECRDKEKLLVWANQMSRWREGKLHMLLSSRQEPDVKKHFITFQSLIQVMFTADVQNADIVRYMEAGVDKMDKWNEERRTMMKTALIKGAGGM